MSTGEHSTLTTFLMISSLPSLSLHLQQVVTEVEEVETPLLPQQNNDGAAGPFSPSPKHCLEQNRTAHGSEPTAHGSEPTAHGSEPHRTRVRTPPHMGQNRPHMGQNHAVQGVVWGTGLG